MSQDHQATLSTVIDRLAALRRHLDHLRELRPRVTGPEGLHGGLSLSNDVLHSLQVVCQAVIDIASALCVRRKLRFDDYTQAVRNLATFSEFPLSMVRELEKLPEFRNTVIYESMTLDSAMVIKALDRLGPVEEFAEIIRRIEAGA